MAARSSTTRERARLAAAARHHPDDAEVLAAARDRLRAAVAEDYITRIVDTAPPLTAEQRARLAVLLLAPGGGNDE
jgi:hypothetical protein